MNDAKITGQREINNRICCANMNLFCHKFSSRYGIADAYFLKGINILRFAFEAADLRFEIDPSENFIFLPGGQKILLQGGEGAVVHC